MTSIVPLPRQRSPDPPGERALRINHVLDQLPDPNERAWRSDFLAEIVAMIEAATAAGDNAQRSKWEGQLLIEEIDANRSLTEITKRKSENRRADLRVFVQVTAPTALALFVSIFLHHG